MKQPQEDRFKGKLLKDFTKNELKQWRKMLLDQRNDKKKRGVINNIFQAPSERILEETDKLMNIFSYAGERLYRTQEWKKLRYRVLKEQGTVCVLCGASPRTGAEMHVDHILPKSLYPEKSLDYDNLQVLCSLCNEGKSNKDKTDWRNGGGRVILRKCG